MGRERGELAARTVLGIAFLRDRYEPRLTPWLLALALPALLVISTLLGHNGLALLPLFLAWGATGLRLWRAGDREPADKLAESAQPAGTGVVG